MHRGWIAGTPRTTSLADESYLDFVASLRADLFTKGFQTVAAAGHARLEAAGLPVTLHEPAFEALAPVFDGTPASQSWRRMMRTSQEMMWRRTMQSFAAIRDAHEAELAAAETAGPGALVYDPDFVVPECYRCEIHLQPGGYTDDPAGGLVFHYGTKVFYLGGNDDDEIQKEIAALAVPPTDGRVARVVDLGCSIGQATMPLKTRFPDADVWGLDVGLPMVRYAHWLANQRGNGANFKQALAEETGFADASVDMCVSYILFHEVPQANIPKILAEAHRILRPGGVFSIFEFPTAKNGLLPAYRWMIDFDSRNNCEPYSVDFVWSDFDAQLRDAGFAVEPGPKTSPMFPEALIARKAG